MLSIFQRYKMKSNHNPRKEKVTVECGAFNISKIQDEIKSQLVTEVMIVKVRCFQYFKDTRWNQITTAKLTLDPLAGVLSIFQRYKMKSNHNWTGAGYATAGVLSIFQRYKMKSNHNTRYEFDPTPAGAFNISKIQDEIKSQPMSNSSVPVKRCFQYFKDTRWNQITTKSGVSVAGA